MKKSLVLSIIFIIFITSFVSADWTSTGGDSSRTRYVNTGVTDGVGTRFAIPSSRAAASIVYTKISTSDNLVNYGNNLYVLISDGNVSVYNLDHLGQEIAIPTDTYIWGAGRIAIESGKLYAINRAVARSLNLVTGGTVENLADRLYLHESGDEGGACGSYPSVTTSVYASSLGFDPIVFNNKLFFEIWTHYYSRSDRTFTCPTSSSDVYGWGTFDSGDLSFNNWAPVSGYKVGFMSKISGSNLVVVGLGSVLYFVDGDGTQVNTYSPGCTITSHIAVKGNLIYFACGNKIIELNPSNFEKREITLSTINSAITGINNEKTFAISDDKIFFAYGQVLYALDYTSLQLTPLGSTDQAGSDINVVTAVNGAVYVGTDNGTIIAYNTSSTPIFNKLWQTSLAKTAIPVDTIIIPRDNEMIALVDRVLWKFNTPTCYDEKKNQGELAVDCGGPCNDCPLPSDIMFRLSLPYTATAAKYNYLAGDYQSLISYSGIFGTEFPGTTQHNNDGGNRIFYMPNDYGLASVNMGCFGTPRECRIMRTSEDCSDQDGCTWNSGTGKCEGTATVCTSFSSDSTCSAQVGCSYFDTPIYYGDLRCTAKSNCNSAIGEHCVLTLNDSIESAKSYYGLVAKCDSPLAYSTKICCSSEYAQTGGVYEGSQCQVLTNNESCLDPANNCTWFPPGTSTDANGGGCCAYGEFWQNTFPQGCIESLGDICNNIFRSDSIQLSMFDFSSTPPKYCAKVVGDLSYGLWYDVETY